MNVLVVSDLHVGSPYCRREALLAFLRALPPEADLVLNGDVLDRGARQFTELDEAILEQLRQEASRRRVVWVAGNHDRRRRIPNEGRIERSESFRIGNRLLVEHGDRFDRVFRLARPLARVVRALYRARVRLGGPKGDISAYRRVWLFFYAILRRHMMHNAARAARAAGCEAIACGHSHYAETCWVGKVRYLNTGAWTEWPAYGVRVTDREITWGPVVGQPAGDGRNSGRLESA